MISSDLTWNNHIVDCIKKANKCLYFIVLLKRACVSRHCEFLLYNNQTCTRILRSSLSSRTTGLSKRRYCKLSIILPDMSYRECLDCQGLQTLYDRRNKLGRQLFGYIATNHGHKLYPLLPARKQSRASKDI